MLKLGNRETNTEVQVQGLENKMVQRGLTEFWWRRESCWGWVLVTLLLKGLGQRV